MVSTWPRNILAVTAASFVGFTGFTLVMPFLPLFIRQLGVTDVGDIALWTGAILGVTPALTAVMSPFWGRLADRFGHKIMVVRSLLACTLVMASIAFTTRPWQVFALRATLGLLTGYGSLALTMAAESAPRDRLASAIGTVQTAQRLGPAIGPVIGGLFAASLGLRPTFLVTAGFYAVALFLVLVLYSEPRRTAERRGDAAPAAVRFRSVLAFQNFALLMALVFGIQFVDRSIGPILPLFLEQIGVSRPRLPLTAGLLFSTMAGAGALGHHVCGRLLRSFRAGVVISGAAGAAACGVAIAGLGVSPWQIALAVVLFGGGTGVVLTAAYTAAGTVIPAGAHGTGFGLLSSASLTGVAVSPVAAGFVGATSLRAVFLVDLVVLAVLVGLVHRLFVEHPRLEEGVPLAGAVATGSEDA